MTKQLVILGSTGSIGRQTLDVARHLPVRIRALAAGSNVELLARQCREYRPDVAVMATEQAAKDLRKALDGQSIEILVGEEGMIEAARLPGADTVITSVVGMLGLRPTLAAIRAGKRIGLANKETMVCAGALVMAAAKEYGAEIIPVDSEHSAIFQCLLGCRDRSQVKKLILTCSGGPFFGMDRAALEKVTVADALRHPNWHMGPKTSKGERVFSSPLQARRKFSKWLDIVLSSGTKGSLEAISRAFSSGIIFRGEPWLPQRKVSSLE